MVMPAASSAFWRSSTQISNLSGLCARSRHTASVKKFSSGTSSMRSAPGLASKCTGASTCVPLWSPMASARVAEEKLVTVDLARLRVGAEGCNDDGGMVRQARHTMIDLARQVDQLHDSSKAKRASLAHRSEGASHLQRPRCKDLDRTARSEHIRPNTPGRLFAAEDVNIQRAPGRGAQ